MDTKLNDSREINPLDSNLLTLPRETPLRFENLSDDMHEVFKQLNIENITLPHELKGSEDDYREHYDDEENDLIIDIYKEEIAMFGYSLDSKCLK